MNCPDFTLFVVVGLGIGGVASVVVAVYTLHGLVNWAVKGAINKAQDRSCKELREATKELWEEIHAHARRHALEADTTLKRTKK